MQILRKVGRIIKNMHRKISSGFYLAKYPSCCMREIHLIELIFPLTNLKINALNMFIEGLFCTRHCSRCLGCISKPKTKNPCSCVLHSTGGRNKHNQERNYTMESVCAVKIMQTEGQGVCMHMGGGRLWNTMFIRQGLMRK